MNSSENVSIALLPTVYIDSSAVQSSAGEELTDDHISPAKNREVDSRESNKSDACSSTNETDRAGEDDDSSGKMSLPEATFTLLCQQMGGSDLSLPYAVSQGGIVVLVLLVVLPFVCAYTALIIVKCMYKVNPLTRQKERMRSTFSDLSEACWHRHGRKLMFTLHSLVLILISSLYLVLCGSFLTHAFTTLPLTKRMWTAVGTFVILPLVFVKSLSKLAWVSVVGVVVIIIPIGITLVYSFARLGEWDIESVGDIKMEGIPIGVNIVIFTYGVHTIIPRIEKGMVNPENYNQVILYNYILSTIFKSTIALVGYSMFTSSTLQLITNNLPTGVWTIIVSCFLGLKVLCSYPFLMYVVCGEVESVMTSNSRLEQLMSPRVRYFCIRIFLVLLTLFVALVVPQFGTLVAYIGSIGASLLVFILPGLFNLVLRRRETNVFEKLLDVFVIVLGMFSCVFGVYFTSKALVTKYNS